MPASGDKGRRLAALRLVDGAKWRSEVKSALEGGSVPVAAKTLGVSRRTLERWIADEPRLTKGLEMTGRGRPKR